MSLTIQLFVFQILESLFYAMSGFLSTISAKDFAIGESLTSISGFVSSISAKDVAIGASLTSMGGSLSTMSETKIL
jgi:hypothetical protein